MLERTELKKIINHFKKNDAVLFAQLQRVLKIEGTVNLTVNANKEGLFASLAWSIINQQLSKKAAETIFSRFKQLFRQEKIEPKQLATFKAEQLRTVGISYQKINYLQDLAKKILAKKVILEKFKTMDNEEIIEQLVKIKGIGTWTAEMFLMFALGRKDIFSYGDLILRTRVEQLYFDQTKNKPTQRQVEEITIKWKPYRTYASRILWRSHRIKS